MKYAEYNEEGVITGFFDDTINKVIPDNTIPITEKQWEDCISNTLTRQVNISTKKIKKVTPKVDPVLEKEMYINSFNQDVGEARLKFVTSVKGQDLIYKMKADEASGLLSGSLDLDDCLFIKEEAKELSLDPLQLADTVLKKRKAWLQLAAKLEALRKKGNHTLGQAKTKDLRQVYLSFKDQLVNIEV